MIEEEKCQGSTESSSAPVSNACSGLDPTCLRQDTLFLLVSVMKPNQHRWQRKGTLAVHDTLAYIMAMGHTHECSVHDTHVHANAP